MVAEGGNVVRDWPGLVAYSAHKKEQREVAKQCKKIFEVR